MKFCAACFKHRPGCELIYVAKVNRHFWRCAECRELAAKGKKSARKVRE